MIWHQEVIANQPRLGLAPGLQEDLLNGSLGDPRSPFFRADGNENDGGPLQRDADSSGRFASVRVVLFRH
jgi:hypothetical protein